MASLGSSPVGPAGRSWGVTARRHCEGSPQLLAAVVGQASDQASAVARMRPAGPSPSGGQVSTKTPRPRGRVRESACRWVTPAADEPASHDPDSQPRASHQQHSQLVEAPVPVVAVGGCVAGSRRRRSAGFAGCRGCSTNGGRRVCWSSLSRPVRWSSLSRPLYLWSRSVGTSRGLDDAAQPASPAAAAARPTEVAGSRRRGCSTSGSVSRGRGRRPRGCAGAP